MITRIRRACCLSWLSISLLACSADDDDGGDGNLYATLARSASNVRDLPFKRDVDIRVITRAEYEDEREPLSPETVALMRETWGRFGFFAPEDDIDGSDAAADDLVAAYYRPGLNEITIIGEPSNETIVHEYVHALQDQHFDLVKFDELVDSSDDFLTRRAVGEGDAMLAEARYYLRPQGVDLDGVDWGMALTAYRNLVEDLLADESGPLFFLAYVSFAYIYGQEYALAKLTGSTVGSPEPTHTPPYDWARNNATFQTPPPSTFALYIQNDQLVPTDVGLREVPSSLAGQLLGVGEDQLGMWMIYLLLYPLDAPAKTFYTAYGWRSDRVLFVQDRATQQHGFVWTTVWDSDLIAQDVVNYWWQLHGGQDQGSGHGTSATGESLYLVRRGPTVVMARNVNPELVVTLGEEALVGTERHMPSLAMQARSAKLRADFLRLVERRAEEQRDRVLERAHRGLRFVLAR